MISHLVFVPGCGNCRWRRREIARAIERARDGFGHPHLHSGSGIRRLRENYSECRVGLRLRLVFRTQDNILLFIAAGSHAEIEAFLKIT